MLGGFAALTGMVSLDSVVAAINGRFAGPVAEGNAAAARAAFDFGVCPDNAIIKLGDGRYEIDYDYCKGCGLCVAECPSGAIEMTPELA